MGLLFLLGGYAVIFGLGVFVHIMDWVSKNGYEFYGICVNRFGESYSAIFQSGCIGFFQRFHVYLML